MSTTRQFMKCKFCVLFLVWFAISLLSEVKASASCSLWAYSVPERVTTDFPLYQEPQNPQNPEESVVLPVVKKKRVVFRIQIFTGGNSRRDRQQAIDAGSHCRENFPELSIYTHFVSPRWICRVGDFRTKAEAANYVRQMRKLRIFRETSVVKCTIVVKTELY